MIGVSLKRENDNEEILTNRLRVSMTKEELVEKIRELLKTDNDLDFLLRLKKEEL